MQVDEGGSPNLRIVLGAGDVAAFPFMRVMVVVSAQWCAGGLRHFQLALALCS